MISRITLIVLLGFPISASPSRPRAAESVKAPAFQQTPPCPKQSLSRIAQLVGRWGVEWSEVAWRYEKKKRLTAVSKRSR
jgi:hypothetical protein